MAKNFVDPRTLHTAVYIDDSTLEPIMNCNLMGGDIQLGSVEIKNSDTDDRLFVNTDGSIDINQNLSEVDYAPGYKLGTGSSIKKLTVDPNGALVSRATILTDEGGYRVNFSGSNLYIQVPSVTLYSDRFTTYLNLSDYDFHINDYIYNSIDSSDFGVQVGSITYDNSTNLYTGTFNSNYSGTLGSCSINVQVLKSVIGNGSSISISNGICTISSGTTDNSVIELERDVDYLPCIKQFNLSLSKRDANQDIYTGFYDENNGSNARFFAWFHFDGTNNRTVKCETASNRSTTPSPYEIETSVIQLTGDKTTSKPIRFRIECSIEKVVFYIDDAIVATHYKSIPRPYDFLTSTMRIVNKTSVSTTTYMYVDYDMVSNFNKINIVQNKDDAAPVTSGTALEYSPASIITPKPSKINRYEFARSTTLGRFFDTIINAGTQTITASTSGNMTMISGTTANAETILRSKYSVKDAFMLSGVVTCSARTANTDMYIEMVDVIGDSLSFSISGTTVVVTVSNHGLEAGQSIDFGAIANLSGGPTVIPGRWVITSVTSTSVTLTATGSSGTGTGTCSLFGANFSRIQHLGSLTTAQAYFDCGRWGYSSGNTTAVVNTITSGHYFSIMCEDGLVSFGDATANAATITERAQRTNNIPDYDVNLYLQLRLKNLSAGPASSVTYTYSFLQVEDGATMPVTVRAGRMVGSPNVLPVRIHASTTIAASQSGTWTVQPGNTANTTAWLQTLVASAAQGYGTFHKLASAATTNATSVKASAGTIGVLNIVNTSANVRYFKIFNKASTPTVGTDTPVFTMTITGNSTLQIPVPTPGIRLSTGIAYAITGAYTDLDTTAIGANEVYVNMIYV